MREPVDERPEDVNYAERERRLSRLAARQHGVIAVRQLRELGFSAQSISRRVALGRLHRLHRGAYAVGHPRTTAAGRRVAAVLACGEPAAASHRTAAAMLGLLSASRMQDVTVWAGNGGRSRPGIAVHRTASPDPVDLIEQDGVLVTSIARTLCDLGDVVPAGRVRRALVMAEREQLLDMDEVDRALRAPSRRRGPATLRELLRRYDPRWQRTRSGVELTFLDLVAGHGLPAPEVDAPVAERYIADFLWRSGRLIVEVDGGWSHGAATDRRSDARRDAGLRRAGYRVLRVTERDLESPDAVAARVAAALLAR